MPAPTSAPRLFSRQHYHCNGHMFAFALALAMAAEVALVDLDLTKQGCCIFTLLGDDLAQTVEVAIADHHGYFDAVGTGFVRTLRPQAFIIPSWYVAHPAVLPLKRMLNTQRDNGNREVYATCVIPANCAVNNQFIPKLKSLEGHIVVRVAPGGENFQIIVTDNSDDSDRIKLISGPRRCNG